MQINAQSSILGISTLNCYAMRLILNLLGFIFCSQLLAQPPDSSSAANPDKSRFTNGQSMPLPRFAAEMDANTEPFTISAIELNQKIQDGEVIAILDARSQKEYTVSHLKSARRVGFEDFSTERVWMIRRQLPVVVYCTNGDRSKVVANYLVQMGFKNVRVLDGSLLAWCNDGFPVYNANNNKTEKVHVFAKENNTLLKKGKAIW